MWPKIPVQLGVVWTVAADGQGISGRKTRKAQYKYGLHAAIQCVLVAYVST